MSKGGANPSVINRGSKKAQRSMAEAPFSLYCGDSNETPTFQEGFASVANLLRGRKNVLVLAGAGISVSCGIPDFRTKGTGLYSTLDAQGLGLSCAEELFDLEVFNEDPRPFYRFSKALYPGSVQPSTSHRFLALLERKKMLLRVYTQNIDGLEEIAGVSPKRVVHAHGSLRWAQCTKCRARMDASDIAEDVRSGTVPRCRRPRGRSGGGGVGLKRKESTESVGSGSVSSSSDCHPVSNGAKRTRHMSLKKLSSLTEADFESGGSEDLGTCCQLDDEVAICGGVIKPGVTFFGEKLDDKVRRSLEADHPKADALVVIGTSLSVAPMSKVIKYLPPSIPRILINRTFVKPPKEVVDEDSSGANGGREDFRDGYVFDACLLGFCDDVTRSLVKELTSQENCESKSGKRLSVVSDEEGRLLSDTKSEADALDINHWSCKLPAERTFLFPGAVLDTNDDSDSDITYQEVAHCDGCQKEISGTIMKCTNCFDFDLCKKCFRKLRKKHANGKHKFVAEG